MSEQSDARRRLGIDLDRRVILSLDGGGIRGIMTLQLLKRLEQEAGLPCWRLVDMVAGTSTGGIIASLIATGKNAIQVEDLYLRFVRKVFAKRNLFASRLVNPPEYCKSNYRQLLRNVVGDQTLEQACKSSGLDLLVTAKDVVQGEETFFSCFCDSGVFVGTYKAILLRAAMEATMSAPTFFYPMERFVDGGTTVHNNPAIAALIEATRYGPPGKYPRERVTILSFGTGCRTPLLTVSQIAEPKGPDAFFWLAWLLNESGNDASDMQSYLLRTKGLCGVDYRRFQISLDRQALAKLPNLPLATEDETPAMCLHDLSDEELSSIELDNVRYFGVMKRIGEAMADYVCQKQQSPFGTDLLDEQGKELLVTRNGDTQRIGKQMGSSSWVDAQRA